MTDILTSEDIKDFFPSEANKIKNKKINTIMFFLSVKHNEEFDKIVKKHIVCNKNIRNGQATIKGTRITVYDVLYMLNEKNGNGLDYIYEQYPSITNKEQILAAVLYIIKKTNTISMILGIMRS